MIAVPFFSYRAMHGCRPLAFDSALARSAQKWAEELAKNQCMIPSDQTTYGENLAYMGLTKETRFTGKHWLLRSL